MKTYLQEKLTEDQMAVVNGSSDVYIASDQKGASNGVATLDVNGKVPSSQLPSMNYIPTSQKGAASGVATLGSDGKVPSGQLPSYVDDVVEYDAMADFPETGETGKIYVDKSTNRTYRWSGSTYVQIGGGLVIGETSATAYRGDRGKTAYEHSQVTSGNPHGVTKSDVGLGNVGNFKAVSTVAGQGLTDTEKSSARANIGAGTSSFSGSYTDLTNKPTIPTQLSQLSGDASHRTVTDTEKLTWNGKQDALGYTPYNATNPSGYQTASQVSSAIAAKMGSDTNGVWIDV